MQQNNAIARVWPWLVLAVGLAACDAETVADAPESRVAIDVAPLSLPGIDDATYTLTVIAGSDTVWSQTVTSSAYGDGAGSVSYVGPCDASVDPNTVQLELDELRADGAPLTDGVDYNNPAPSGSPIELDVTCAQNADTPVTFDLTVARAASQGFFDIGVNFSDIFCSAKLDCLDAEGSGDLKLLFNPLTGARDLTAVLGFSCTAGPGSSTILALDPVTIVCDSGDAFFVDVAGGPGNLNPPFPGPTNDTDLIFQAAVFRGAELIAGAGKAYWNVAIGLNSDAFDNLGACVMTAAGTVFEGTSSDGATPADTTYPFVSWYVELVDEDGLYVCGANELNNSGEAVVIDQTDVLGRPFYATFLPQTTTVETHAPSPDGTSVAYCEPSLVPSHRSTSCTIYPLNANTSVLGHGSDFSPSAAPSGSVPAGFDPDFGYFLGFTYQAGGVEETVTISPNPGADTTVDVFDTIQLERGYDSTTGDATYGYHYACVSAAGTPGDGDADCVPAAYQIEASWLLVENNNPGTAPVYSCTRPNEAFVSTDSGCNGGGTNAGAVAFIFTSEVPGVTEAETLKLCLVGGSYFMSSTPDCEGHTTVDTLGYALGNY